MLSILANKPTSSTSAYTYKTHSLSPMSYVPHQQKALLQHVGLPEALVTPSQSDASLQLANGKLSVCQTLPLSQEPLDEGRVCDDGTTTGGGGLAGGGVCGPTSTPPPVPVPVPVPPSSRVRVSSLQMHGCCAYRLVVSHVKNAV
jgi:hypothetical protein